MIDKQETSHPLWGESRKGNQPQCSSFTWNDLVSFEYGKPVDDKDKMDGPVPVYGTNGQIGTSHLQPLCPIPSFIVGRKGAYRGIHYSSVPFSVIDTAFYVLPKTQKVDLKWAYYKFLTYDINGMNRGGAIPSTDRKELCSIKVELPSLAEQKRIVGILSAYDDLIENNRKRIALLEETARQLYREWFVRFHFPGHGRTPFVHGVPKGWKRCQLVDMIDINPLEPRPKTDVIRYVPMSALATTDMVVDLSETELRTSSTPVRFRNGDTLLARITPCLENGKTGFVNFLPQGEVACGSTEFIVLRGRTVSPAFVYCLARTDDFRETAIKSMIGSSGRQRVQTACLAEYPMLQPPAPMLDRFDGFALPLFKQIATLSRESERLASARDALLPRLMKGGAA